eukprot:g21306.t2
MRSPSGRRLSRPSPSPRDSRERGRGYDRRGYRSRGRDRRDRRDRSPSRRDRRDRDRRDRSRRSPRAFGPGGRPSGNWGGVPWPYWGVGPSHPATSPSTLEGGLALHKMSWMERFFWSWIWLATGPVRSVVLTTLPAVTSALNVELRSPITRWQGLSGSVLCQNGCGRDCGKGADGRVFPTCCKSCAYLKKERGLMGTKILQRRLPDWKVVRCERIEDAVLWDKYTAKRAQLRERSVAKANIQPETAESIQYSANTTLDHRAEDQKIMLLCRVALGGVKVLPEGQDRSADRFAADPSIDALAAEGGVHGGDRTEVRSLLQQLNKGVQPTEQELTFVMKMAGEGTSVEPGKRAETRSLEIGKDNLMQAVTCWRVYQSSFADEKSMGSILFKMLRSSTPMRRDTWSVTSLRPCSLILKVATRMSLKMT